MNKISFKNHENGTKKDQREWNWTKLELRDGQDR